MKLNAAAVESVCVFFAVLLLAVVFSGSASALDSIDLSNPSEQVSEDGCSQLIQIKYPFLSCASGEIGLSDEEATWDNSRRIPLMSAWTEGDAAWGPSLNGFIE